MTKVPKEEDDQLYFDNWDERTLQRTIDQQHQIIELQKSRDHKKLHGVAVIIDDFADNPQVVRHSRALTSLFFRGRHQGISTFASVQKWRTLASGIRTNALQVCIYRLRNGKELEAILEEVSAAYKHGREGREIVQEIYEEATREPHSFLFVNLVAKDKRDLFWRNFTHRLVHVEGAEKEITPGGKGVDSPHNAGAKVPRGQQGVVGIQGALPVPGKDRAHPQAAPTQKVQR